MRYRRGVEKLQTLAEACESVEHWPPGDPFLVQAYVFGRLLAGDDPVDTVEVVLMLNLPPEEVTWGSNPKGTARLADTLRPMPSPQELREQHAGELHAALAHLRAVQSAYWDRDWRRDHRELGRYPENELCEAVQGYLDLQDAIDTFEAVTDTK